MKLKFIPVGLALATSITLGACGAAPDATAASAAASSASAVSATPTETPTPEATPEATPASEADAEEHPGDVFQETVAQTDEMVIAGEYQQAIAQLAELEKDHPEAKDRRLQAEFLCASANLNRKNTTTYGYLTELVKEKYPGASVLYDALYNWDFKIYVNQSEEDTASDYDDFLREEPICVHIRAIGGPPDGSVKVSAQAYFLHAGELGTYSAELANGEELLIRGRYQSDDDTKTDSLFIDLFDEDGELIDEDFAWIN